MTNTKWTKCHNLKQMVKNGQMIKRKEQSEVVSKEIHSTNLQFNSDSSKYVHL